METTQAKALASPGVSLTDKAGVELSIDDKAILLDAVNAVLNGLEHLAVGVKYKIYNRELIMALGGTIIINTWERYRPYIEETRHGATAATSQRLAWTDLEDLAKYIKRKRKVGGPDSVSN